MSYLADDERFEFVAPTDTTPWGITVRRSDGSYREPEPEELFCLLRNYEMARKARRAA